MTKSGWTLIDVTDLGAITYKTVPAAHAPAPVEFICRDATPPSVTNTAPSTPRSSLSKSSKWSWTVMPSPRKAMMPGQLTKSSMNLPVHLRSSGHCLGLPVPRKDEELNYVEQRGLISQRQKLNAWADEERAKSEAVIEARWNGRIARAQAARQSQATLDMWRHHRDRDVADREKK